MASHASIRRPGTPYNYETPEQKARDVLRGQRTIARVTTNADQRVQSVAALQALAKATGVPEKELPAGGIHSGMSPADVQAATDRINGWVARQQGVVGGGAPAAKPPTMSQVASGSVNPESDNYQVASVAQAPQAPASPAPQTRTTPTGGTETLVSSESGPRWVASVSNAPAPNNMNGQISRDPGGRTVQVQQAPIALRPTRPGQPVASVAQNLDFYRNPTQAVGTGRPWTPPAAVVTSQAEGAQIAKRYGDPLSGGMVTNGPWTPSTPGYAGDGRGAPPYIPPAMKAYASTPSAPKTAPSTPAPIAQAPAIPGMVKDPSSPSGYTGVPASSAPPAPVNPATSPSRVSALNQPFNPDDDDSEEAKRRLAVATGRAPAPASKPYQFTP